MDPSARRLTEVLRDDLGLWATKVGCDAGDCGACTVLLDGEPVSACMTPVGRLAGRHVETLEGLHASGEASGLQGAFLAHGAAQCGICTPGMLVAAAALLRGTSAPSEPQVMDALGGVLCRCTGYRKIVAAVMDARTVDVVEESPPAGKAVGHRVRARRRRPQGRRHRRLRRRPGLRGCAADPGRAVAASSRTVPVRRPRCVRGRDAGRDGRVHRRRHRRPEPLRGDPRHGRSTRVRRGRGPVPRRGRRDGRR